MFPLAAKEQMAQLLEETARRSGHFSEIASTAQSAAIKGGPAAEQWHAGTQSMDAILKGKSSRTYTDMDPEWGRLGHIKNDPSADLRTVVGNDQTRSAQVKYHRSNSGSEPAQATTDQMGLLDKNTRQPKYKDVDAYIGPSDQINPTDGKLSVAELARRKAAKTAETRPEVSESMKQVADKATDRLEPGDGTSSKPLEKKQAEDLGRQNERGKRNWVDTTGEYQTHSTIKQMGKAATGAAAIAAVSAGVFNTLRYAKAVREGRMTADEAAYKIVAETGAAATDCAVKAAANTGVQSVIVRHGGKKAAEAVLKNSFGGIMKTSAITVAVIASVDLAKNLVMLSAGKMTKAEFEERSGKSVINTGASVYGGAIGAAIGSPFFPPIGMYIGSVLGAMVSGMAMQFAIENGIEKEFREVVQDTGRVKEDMELFQSTAGNMLGGQVLFAQYLQQEAAMNRDLNHAAERIRNAGDDMQSAIDKL
jgi:hypothetical protein